MILTNDVGSLLRIVHYSSYLYLHATFHARKWADMNISVVHVPRWPLMLPRQVKPRPSYYVFPMALHQLPNTSHDARVLWR